MLTICEAINKLKPLRLRTMKATMEGAMSAPIDNELIDAVLALLPDDDKQAALGAAMHMTVGQFIRYGIQCHKIEALREIAATQVCSRPLPQGALPYRVEDEAQEVTA